MPFSVYTYYLYFFSWLIQTFLGGGITRQDKSAILSLRTWSSVLWFYVSEMNCSEPLFSSVIESCIYFAIDDFVMMGLFKFSFFRGDLKEEQCYSELIVGFFLYWKPFTLGEYVTGKATRCSWSYTSWSVKCYMTLGQLFKAFMWLKRKKGCPKKKIYMMFKQIRCLLSVNFY